jgi:SPP1 family predicted phage head-tail adaptor
VIDYSTNPAVLNKRVFLLREIVLRDEEGGSRIQWRPFASVYAGIENLTGREYWQASQTQGESSSRIVFRKLAGVTDRTRVLVKNAEGKRVVYEAKSPPMIVGSQEDYIEMMCRVIEGGPEE